VLINEKDLFVAQVCHIKAAEEGGPRFDAEQTDEERRAAENLLLLCHRHHVETDDEADWSVDRMIDMKRTHEAKFSENRFSISEALATQLQAETARYWRHIAVLNNEAHSMPELSMPVDAHATGPQLVTKLETAISNLEGFIEEICEPLGESSEHWEAINLAIPNWLQSIRILIMQIEIKFAEADLVAAPGDHELRSRLVEMRGRFEEVSQHAICVD